MSKKLKQTPGKLTQGHDNYNLTALKLYYFQYPSEGDSCGG